MVTKIFRDKKIIIRMAVNSDFKNVKKFQVFINSLVEEEAKLLMNKKATIEEEREFLKTMLKGVKNKKRIYLIAERDDKVVGSASVELDRWRRNHIGKLGITIINGYRGMGLGKHLMSEVIRLAKKELNPSPKIIQLDVYANNKPAINLYKKMGFKIVAKLPKQIQWKGKLIAEYVMLKYI